MTREWLPVYITIAEFRARVRRAVDVQAGRLADDEQEIKALRALVAELCVEGARLREQVAALRGGGG